VVAEAVAGCSGLVHLAAIVGDPACAREPELAREINLDASQALYRQAAEHGVERFVFASTCSNYGKMDDPHAYVDERSPLRPVSLYAETKVAFERFLLDQPLGGSRPTLLRFSTVYGRSPRMRFDLTVNEFTRELVLDRELEIFGEQFWRPYCHVRDLARSARLALEAPSDRVAFEVFNVGDTDENYRKIDIVEAILRELPNGKVSYVERSEDPRDYRVAFEKIAGLGFAVTRRVPDGIREVRDMLEMGLLRDPDDPRYANVPQTHRPVSPSGSAGA
jgi:nucleoside-diphosphate-sugar epimerase